MIRTYTELQLRDSLEDRFDYLSLGGVVGETTFGFDRWINQKFYTSREWKLVRNHVLSRDLGMDLGVEDSPILGAHLIHHMNPLTIDDIEGSTENLIDPEFLITTALRTHNAIHYGDRSKLLSRKLVERSPGDTKLW